MRALACLFFALLLLFLAVSADHQCNYRTYEYLCLVRCSCVVGGTGDRESIVILEPGMTLKNGNCDLIVKIKSVDNYGWDFEIHYTEIQYDIASGLSANIGATSLLTCDNKHNSAAERSRVVGGIYQLMDEHFSIERNGYRSGKCIFSVAKPTSEMRSVFHASSGNFNLRYKMGSDLFEITFLGDVKQLADKVAITRGCNPDLILNFGRNIPDGEWRRLNKILVGKNAEIDCNDDKASQLFFKFPGEPDEKWTAVHKVLCPSQTWAYQLTESSPIEYLGDRKVDLICIRNYCKYCGVILDEVCPTCTAIKQPYENCVPKCPNDLWYFGDSVIRSTLSCKPHPENEANGVWMAKSNGVNVPVEMASCYAGQYPLPRATTTASMITAFIALI